MGKAKRIHNASERNPLNRPAVVIDVPFLDSHAHKNVKGSNTASLSSLDASTSVSNFLLKLNAAVDLAAQVKECHEFKSKYRSCLLKKPLPDHVPSDLTILFILYLHPNYGPLHHCLDWITDASTRAIYAECLAPIREACLIILLHLENALFAHEHHLPLSAPFAKECVASLVEMASIDRDSGWMDSSTSTNSCLLIFLSTVNNILKLCLGVLFPENVAPDAVASLILTDSGLLYTDTCAESLKAVSICLRSRRGKEALMPNDVSESRILTSILTSTFPLLTFDFINRVFHS